MVFSLHGKTYMVLNLSGMIWHIYYENASDVGYQYITFIGQDYGI